MKFKTKYNIGDVVIFYGNPVFEKEVGQIDKIKIDFSWETSQRTQYSIKRININSIRASITVSETDIQRKLNKKAFEKEFTKLCVREVLKDEQAKK